MTRYYNGEVDTGYIVRDSTILMAPNGYHTVVSAPGYTTYYLWALAGNHRIQATADDPALSWVGRTVPMLRRWDIRRTSMILDQFRLDGRVALVTGRAKDWVKASPRRWPRPGPTWRGWIVRT